MKKINILSLFGGKKVVGLYVSRETVDLVVLKGTLKGPKLIKFGQTYIYPNRDSKEEIILESVGKTSVSGEMPKKKVEPKTKDDYIVEAIRRVFKENDVKPDNVVCAVASDDVMVRYFQMPKIPKETLWNSAIDFEAKRYIPFRMEDVASDFQVTPSNDSSGSMDVVFVAVKQNVVEGLVNLLEKAGVRTRVLEPAPFSLIRAFNAAEQINNKINTVIVNIEAGIANINILRKGVPYIIRDIPLDSEISKEGKVIEPIFEKLLSEIKLSFDFYEKQFSTEVIEKIIIYSHRPLENWGELVGKELQIPVEVGDPLRGIRIKKGVVPPGLAISFGLALRGISGPCIDVNLYKEKLLAYKQKELFFKMLFLQASAAVLLLVILKLLCMRAITPLANELKHTLSTRPKVQISIKEDDVNELEKISNKIKEKKILLEGIISSRTYITTRLMDLAKLVPQDIWLTEVSFEEKVDKKNVSKISRQLSIMGYCVVSANMSETDIVNKFLTDLKQGRDIKKGMSKMGIASLETKKMQGRKVANFGILFTGP
ncbi:MAG: pilus assembly protein PilM [Candidatus Omnitrophica bacterium]|nr:pilus assembly protein PilM [Candidatus Omnitrophota bacterium]